MSPIEAGINNGSSTVAKMKTATDGKSLQSRESQPPVYDSVRFITTALCMRKSLEDTEKSKQKRKKKIK